MLELVEAVRAEVDGAARGEDRPVVHRARALRARPSQAAGADGLVLFNRFYQPDIDLDTLEVTPRLSCRPRPSLRLPLHWIAILRGVIACSLAASTGVHDGDDVAEAAARRRRRRDDDQRRCCIARSRAPRAMLEAGLREWMAEREYESRRPAPRQREPAQRPRSRGLRARQLHAGAAVLRRSELTFRRGSCCQARASESRRRLAFGLCDDNEHEPVVERAT